MTRDHLLRRACLPLLLAALAPAPAAAAPAAGAPRVPAYKVSETIPVSAAPADGRPRYPAFPALLELGEGRVLVTCKDGTGHTHDPGAEVATLVLDLGRGTRTAGPRFTPPAPLLYQCGEPVRLADGRIALFLDTQFIGPEPRHYRAPMRWSVSADDGRTFSAPAIFPVVDGVGYGYPQEGLTTGDTTHLLVMTFGYLTGGRWGMDVLRTRDAGATWTRVRNLAAEFGVPGFAEGGLLPHADGFLVVSRSYDRRTRLHEVDGEFRLRRQADLTGAAPWLNSYVGRPRLLRHRGEIYLIGRNWTRPIAGPGQASERNPLAFPPAQQLCLFRIDPATLQPTTCWILDNAEDGPVSDGYYAVTATTGAPDDERLHVLTYKAVAGGPTALVRLEFRWRELRE
ncbi:MAG: exo-alpha-sialidase [Opitutaceae bacterium]|nr:exo-alpha-sialidase [Opitutaceae bacterium]